MSFPPHMPMMPPMPFFPPMMIPPPNLSTPPPGLPVAATNNTQKPGDNEKKSRCQGATTVFVGSISDRAPDVMIKRMLQLCGDVVNWKRIQGADGKLQAFGFCEYENPEGTLRCIRLLNGYQIQDKKLLVKVDAKTKTVIDEYKKKKRRELAKKAAKDMTAFKLLYEDEDENKTDENSTDADGKKKSGEEGEIEEDDDDYIDNDTRREDSAVKQAIETVMREYSREMNLKALEAKEQAMRAEQMAAAAAPPPPPPPSVPTAVVESPTSDDQSTPSVAQRVDPTVALENEEEKRSLITNEIQLFRNRFKDEETKMRNTEKERRDRYERERAQQREKRAAEESAKSPSSPNDDRHRSSSSRHHTSNSIRSLTNDRRTPTSSSSRYDRRSPRSYHRRSRTKSPISKSHRNDEDDEETIERKRQERRVREKENQYRDRLKAWEQRERKKRSDYQAEKQRELLRLRDEEKERKISLTFHENYNDDTHDFIYYKGAALARRIKDREREIDLDKRDRQREKDEIEDLRKKLSSEGKYDNIDLEIKQRLKKEEETIRKRLADIIKATSDISSEESDDEQETKKKSSTSIKKESTDRANSNSFAVSDSGNKEPLFETKVKTESSQNDIKSSPPHTSALGGAPISGTKIASKRRLAVNEAFRDDQEDENTTTLPKKSKLSAIPDQQSPIPQPIPVAIKEEEPTVVKNSDTNTNSNSMRLQEEKRQAVCKLIESIPTKKEDLFTYPLDWSLLDSTLMEKRVKPWVTKKIVEYLGEEEPALTDFICTSIMSKKNAESILNDIRVVLDNEADVFVVKMWRLIVYEIEAKRNGLSK